MFYQPYKHYLDFLSQKSGLSIFQKTFLTSLSIILVTSGMISALFYWQYQKNQESQTQNQYLQIAGSAFTTSSQALNDVFSNFQVLGASARYVDELKEAMVAPTAFTIPQEDVTKTISLIETIRKQIVFQKNQLQSQNVPAEFGSLQQDLMGFYDQSEKLLDTLYSQQKFTKELLMSLGPNFYLPVLTNESLWNQGKSQEIIDYYQKINGEANKTLASLARLNVPEEFKNYFETQIAYLELLVNTSTEITEILSEKDEPEGDITQIEKAYQVLVDAKRQNETIAEDLLTQRLNLLSKETNLAKFAPVKIKQNAIEAKFTDTYSNQLQATSGNFFENALFVLLDYVDFFQ